MAVSSLRLSWLLPMAHPVACPPVAVQVVAQTANFHGSAVCVLIVKPAQVWGEGGFAVEIGFEVFVPQGCS